MTMPSIDRIWPRPTQDISDEDIMSSLDVGHRPWLRVNFVSTVDGAATADGLSGGLSPDADKRVFELLRRLCDVVLVGAGTVRAERYGPMRVSAASAEWRMARGRPAHPVFAIASGSLRLDPLIDPASRIFTDAPVRPIVVTTERSTAAQRARFEPVADVIVAGRDGFDIDAMLSAFAHRGLWQVLSEGGPSLFGSLLAADRVDELCLTVSPILVAGDARRITAGVLDQARPLELAQALVSDSTLLLRYVRSAR